MPKFSRTSLNRLGTCDLRLQKLFKSVVRVFDCTVLEGHRDQKTQDYLFQEGYSKLKWPNSKHNRMPSKAVDVAPWPIEWKDRESFVYMAGIVLGIAAEQGLNIRWGGDWDQDHDLKDQSFNDLVHFELLD